MAFNKKRLATGQAAPGTTAVLVAPANLNRVEVTIYNTHASVNFFAGPAGVTAVTGVPIAFGTSKTFYTADAIYGITAASTSSSAYVDSTDPN